MPVPASSGSSRRRGGRRTGTLAEPHAALVRVELLEHSAEPLRGEGAVGALQDLMVAGSVRGGCVRRTGIDVEVDARQLVRRVALVSTERFTAAAGDAGGAGGGLEDVFHTSDGDLAR